MGEARNIPIGKVIGKERYIEVSVITPDGDGMMYVEVISERIKLKPGKEYTLTIGVTERTK